MKTLVVASFLALSSFTAFSQNCTDCAQTPEAKIDYCFKSELFSGQCAQFAEKSEKFYIQDAKGKALAIAVSEGSIEDLIALSNDKHLKLSTIDVLFIQEALKVWKVEKKKIGFEMQESGLGIKILTKGEGALPENGKTVIVHYTGMLENGTKFDSSVDRNSPFEFPLGQGRVIKGWDEGIAKLPIGTKAILMIPSELGYGSRGAGGMIPPNATLFFEVEVLGVK